MEIKPKVLIIDDDLSVCETLSIALSEIVRVKYFTDTKEAQIYLKKHDDIKLIIIDYKVQNIDGIDFYKDEIKNKGFNIPAILISGFIGQNKSPEEQTLLAKYFVLVLEKPFDIFELINFVESEVLKK